MPTMCASSPRSSAIGSDPQPTSRTRRRPGPSRRRIECSLAIWSSGVTLARSLRSSIVGVSTSQQAGSRDDAASGGAPPAASIVIVTRNRPDALRSALRSATAQEGATEVIVIDDGSTDGTSELVAREFPRVRLLRSKTSEGYIRQRNRGARAARAAIIVSIDDDADFTATDTVETTLRGFDDPRVAAVAMPFVQERRGDDVLQRAPSDEGVWLTNAFIGTAHALRRDIFLELGGYRETLQHLFEEPDLCMRLLRHGYVVRLGRGAPVVHHESPYRNVARDLTYICRNHVLLTWFHVPAGYSLVRVAQILGYVARAAVAWRSPGPALRGLAQGVRYVLAHRGERTPLSRDAYALYRSLRRRPALVDAVEDRLPTRPQADPAQPPAA